MKRLFARVAIGLAGVLSVGTLALGMVVAPAGCFPPPPPEEPDPCNVQIVTLNIYADEVINPNEQDRPRPVVIRLYQLASELKMANARYDDILLRDKEVLGEDLMKVDEVPYLYPNDLVELKFERIPEAQYLVGVALFHTPVGQAWKTFYEFPPMPNTPEACGAAAADAGAEEPQAFPRTEFFVRERKIDNGSEFDASMFPNATRFRAINLPKASATRESQQAPAQPAPGQK